MKNLAIGFVLGLIVAGGVCTYNTLSRITVPSIIAQPSKELKNADTETLVCKSLIVYRDRVKKDLSLPADVVKDAARKVVGATQVAASEYPHTVSAVANIESGKVDMFVRQDPLPWVGFPAQRSVGIAYGWRDGGSAPVARLDGRWDLIQVKALHGGLVGAVDAGGGWFAGVGAEIRF